jgi:hypothetical protein
MSGMDKYRDAYAMHNPEVNSVRMFKLANSLDELNNSDFPYCLLINGDVSLTTYEVSQLLREKLLELVEQFY